VFGGEKFNDATSFSPSMQKISMKLAYFVEVPRPGFLDLHQGKNSSFLEEWRLFPPVRERAVRIIAEQRCS
jgi:hypothetical protein